MHTHNHNTHTGRNLHQWHSNARGPRLVHSQHWVRPPASHPLLRGADSEREPDPGRHDQAAPELQDAGEIQEGGASNGCGEDIVIN